MRSRPFWIGMMVEFVGFVEFIGFIGFVESVGFAGLTNAEG